MEYQNFIISYGLQVKDNENDTISELIKKHVLGHHKPQ